MDKYLISKAGERPRNYSIKSLSDYVALSTYFSENVIFRGQSNHEWPLIPTIGREMDNSNYSFKEEQILEDFKKEAVPYLSYQPHDEWEWLTLAQHNGLPTRFLDWTKSPLAALWFAIRESTPNDISGAVWVYHYREEDLITDIVATSPMSITETKVLFPKYLYPYVQAQTGVFTVHHKVTINNRSCFPPFSTIDMSDILLSKIIIPRQAFATLRYQLFKIGIDASKMFPGLSGIAERIRYLERLTEEELHELYSSSR